MNLLSNYDSFIKSHNVTKELNALRQEAFNYASTKGLPTRKNEDWHYTSVRSLDELTYEVFTNEVSLSHEQLVEIKTHLNSDFLNIVFVNGVLNTTLSSELPSEIVVEEYNSFKGEFADAFDALNAAYLTKPLSLKLKKESSVDKPVNFVFYSFQKNNQAVMVHPRIDLVVGERSSLTLLESYYGATAEQYLVNSVLNVVVKDSATLKYARIQSESEQAFNIGRTVINLQKNANLESLAVAIGGKLSRHSLDIRMVEEGANAEILGITAIKDKQHVDNTSVIDHVVGGCNTNQLYKGILDGEAKSAFTGTVVIQKNAQKANSAQLNNNLLLSSKAEADSRPCLNIYADDVKAAHGSTVGQLNAEELFYLQSRCISKEKAIPMLSYGFLSEVIYKFNNEPVQKWLSQHLDKAFAKFNTSI